MVAGTPAREPVAFGSAEVLNRVPLQVDPSTMPPVVVGQDVADYDHELAGPEMQGIVVTLAQNLELENQALLRRDPAILQAVDHGDRLVEMQARLEAATASGSTEIVHYQFESVAVSLLVPFGVQTGPSLGMAAPERRSTRPMTRQARSNLECRRRSPTSSRSGGRPATAGSSWR